MCDGPEHAAAVRHRPGSNRRLHRHSPCSTWCETMGATRACSCSGSACRLAVRRRESRTMPFTSLLPRRHPQLDDSATPGDATATGAPPRTTTPATLTQQRLASSGSNRRLHRHHAPGGCDRGLFFCLFFLAYFVHHRPVVFDHLPRARWIEKLIHVDVWRHESSFEGVV